MIKNYSGQLATRACVVADVGLGAYCSTIVVANSDAASIYGRGRLEMGSARLEIGSTRLRIDTARFEEARSG